MNKPDILQMFEENPVVLGMKREKDFPIVAQNNGKIVFTLFGNISEISGIVKRLKDMGKLVFVNIDMVDGFSGRNSVIDFMKNNTEADGIISSKASLLRYASEQGFFTIHRFFILDSSSWQSIKKQIEISHADIINVAPGWTKVISWTVNDFDTPVMASGLVCDKETVIASLKAGAIAICTTNHEVWDM